MARGMVDVELVEDEPPAGDPPRRGADGWLRRVGVAAVRGTRRLATEIVPRAARAWRRPVVRWVSLGVAAGLVAVPVADAARERTRLAALALIPGVVRPLHPGMTALYTLDQQDNYLMGSGVLVGGTVVASAPDQTMEVVDGAASAPAVPAMAPPVVGLDPATGKHRWSVTLPPVNGAGAVQGVPVCGAAGDVAICTAREAVAERFSTSLWVLDPVDGKVLRSTGLGEHGWAAVAAGRLVVARQVDGPDRAPATGPWTVTWRVTGEDAATGAAGWTWTSPPVEVAAATVEQDLGHDPADYVSWLSVPARSPAPGDDAVLNVGDDAWVLAPDGQVRTHISRPGGWAVAEWRGVVVRAAILTDPASGAISGESGPGELMLADGTWRAIEGNGIWTSVDDGSAPGVVFLAAGADDPSLDTLTAVDSRTGATAWSIPVPGIRYTSEALLLGGRLYVKTQKDTVGEDRITAYDATTGAVVWTRSDVSPGPVATDGTVLVTTPGDWTGSAGAMQAYALGDGRPLWRDDLGGQGAFETLTAIRRVAGFDVGGNAWSTTVFG